MTPEVRARIDAYRPRAAPDGWDAVADMVRDRVGACEPSTPEMAARLLSAAAGLALWADHNAVPAGPEVVFSDASLERYCATALAGTAGSVATIRSRLRRLRDAGQPKPTPTISRSAARPPYTPDELAGLWRLASAQPTVQRRRRALSVICLSAGAGCSSADLRHVDAESIVDDPEGPTFVNIGGPRPRRVPVLAGFDVALVALAEGVCGPLVAPDPTSRNFSSHLVDDIDGGEDLPRLEVARLRHTWLVCLLDAWVPTAAIMTLAGVKTTRILEELLPYCHQCREPVQEVAEAVRNAWRPPWL